MDNEETDFQKAFCRAMGEPEELPRRPRRVRCGR